jgi:hypothetical protein
MENKNEYVIERLALRTREVYINQIIAGTKKEEYRDLIPRYGNILLHFFDKKKMKWDAVKQVKVLHLYAGNITGGGKFVDVEVKNTILTEYINNPRKGMNTGDMEFIFELGDVIAHN